MVGNLADMPGSGIHCAQIPTPLSGNSAKNGMGVSFFGGGPVAFLSKENKRTPTVWGGPSQEEAIEPLWGGEIHGIRHRFGTPCERKLCSFRLAQAVSPTELPEPCLKAASNCPRADYTPKLAVHLR